MRSQFLIIYEVVGHLSKSTNKVLMNNQVNFDLFNLHKLASDQPPSELAHLVKTA